MSMDDFITHTVTISATFTTRSHVSAFSVEERMVRAIWDTNDYDLLVDSVHTSTDLEGLALVELAGLMSVAKSYASQGIQVAEHYSNEEGA
jgi:hypothetical protein